MAKIIGPARLATPAIQGASTVFMTESKTAIIVYFDAADCEDMWIYPRQTLNFFKLGKSTDFANLDSTSSLKRQMPANVKLFHHWLQ
jgi:hypothetical protein